MRFLLPYQITKDGGRLRELHGKKIFKPDAQSLKECQGMILRLVNDDGKWASKEETLNEGP